MLFKNRLLISMQKTCKNCGVPFEITEEDQTFYAKIDVPEPTLCPHCRQQRRLVFRNDRKLYHRKCDLCGKETISMYDSDSPYKVFCQSCFWSDKWDPMDYGRAFDFSRPFFDQFAELMKAVPRISLMNKEAENAEYCNFSLKNKNSYLLMTCGRCQDSFYSKRSFDCIDICDSNNLIQCELCYECIDSTQCYNCTWLQNSSGCNDCNIGYNLKNCKSCFACFNLVGKSFCIKNQQYSPEEYAEKLVSLKENLSKEASEFYSSILSPRRFMNSLNTENCSGDSIFNSKNASYCFDAYGLEDCKFVCEATHMKDSYDVNNDDNSELVYEAIGSESNYLHRFSDICWWGKFITYCNLCFNNEYIFGCCGLKRKKYCVFNKQYSKEEYEILMAKIIEHMKSTGEWGEFFPIKLSPFAYNETVANDFYRLNQEVAEKNGIAWKNLDKNTFYEGPHISPPGDLNYDVKTVASAIYTCTISGRLYKITPQELLLYKKMSLPLPKKCPDQRYLERMQKKNPRALWQRACAKCGKQILTSYAPDRPEIVYCEECYLKEVY